MTGREPRASSDPGAGAGGRPGGCAPGAGQDPWSEPGYSRRRALSDVLAVLRELSPHPTEQPAPPLSPVADRRLASALAHADVLARIEVPGAGSLHDLLLLLLFKLEASVDAPAPSPAAAFALPPRLGDPGVLHATLLEAIVAGAASPAQDD